MENLRRYMTKIKIIKDICGKPCDLCKMYSKKCMPEIIATKLSQLDYRKQEWISVEDRLPKVGEEVLVYRRSVNEYAVALYSDTYREFFVGVFAFVNVTHWQPLPQPPKMKGAE